MEDVSIRFEEPLEVTIQKHFPKQYWDIKLNGKLVKALNHFESWIINDFLDINGYHCQTSDELEKAGGITGERIREYQMAVRALICILIEVPSFRSEQDTDRAIQEIYKICDSVNNKVQEILEVHHQIEETPVFIDTLAA
ncbi:hypothetical protein K9L27_01995 [Candidatus Gracilibacteria bacterium]|nr:hypothetical protein [Candidatus Gracilibacteria bacterium]